MSIQVLQKQIDLATDLLMVTNDLLSARTKLRQLEETQALDHNKKNRAYHNETKIGQMVVVLKLERLHDELCRGLQ